MADSVLDVRELTVRYGKRVAVDHFSLSLKPGEVVGLLGPNGAGKSTALRAMAGGLPVAPGVIHIAGHDLARAPLAAKASLGLADQPPALYEFLTVAEHVSFVADTRAGHTDSKATLPQLLDGLGLGPSRDRLCRELSYGTRQRVALAAAMIGPPRVLLLDETLNGLDPRASRSAREAIADTARAGVAVLLSTHLLGVVEHVCTRLVIMNGGRLVTDVSGAEFAALRARGPGAVEELYLANVPAEPSAPLHVAPR